MQARNAKRVVFLGSSLSDLRGFPGKARQRAGYALDQIAHGEEPSDWKPMPSVGQGVREVRIKLQDGAFRVFYVISRPEAVYVLHCFRKTTQRTDKRDIDLGKERLASLTTRGP